MHQKFQELCKNKARMKWRPTKAEKQFKQSVLMVLQKRHGIRFESQRIIYESKSKNDFKGYILDYYLPDYKLCIEIDGKSHNNRFQRQYDEVRASLLAKKGIKTIRFTNEMVLTTDDCIKELHGILEDRKRELSIRKVNAIKQKYQGKMTEKPLEIDRDRELRLQSEYIARQGITLLPAIGPNRRFILGK